MFEKLKKNYENLINDEIPIDLRITASRKIVDIIYGSFKNDPIVEDRFHKINVERRERNIELKKQKRYDETQRTYNYKSVNDWLLFFIDHNYIPKSLENSFQYVYREASDWIHAKEGEQNAINSLINFINDILEWFFSKHGKSTDFIKIDPKHIKRKNRKLKRTGIVLFSIVGFLFVIYMVLSEMGNRFITPIEDAIETTLVGEFDPDPVQKELGFVTIYEGDKVRDGANKRDSLAFPDLKVGDEFVFTVFVIFRNMGVINLEEVKAKISYNKINYGKLMFTSELSASNAPSITDTSIITNIPDEFDIEIVRLLKENTHGQTDPNECTGYNYSVNLDVELANKGVDLDVLDAAYNGWCDQGYVCAVYKITIN